MVGRFSKRKKGRWDPKMLKGQEAQASALENRFDVDNQSVYRVTLELNDAYGGVKGQVR
jgi:hypothetical protein